MSSEHCEAEAKLYGNGLKSEAETISAINDLVLELGVYAEGNRGKTDEGFGFIITARCQGWKEKGVCSRTCLRKKLEELRIAKFAKIKGICIHENEPAQESQF